MMGKRYKYVPSRSRVTSFSIYILFPSVHLFIFLYLFGWSFLFEASVGEFCQGGGGVAIAFS